MTKYLVQIAETRNYVIEVEAVDRERAEWEALQIWTKADDVGSYESDGPWSEIVAVEPFPAPKADAQGGR